MRGTPLYTSLLELCERQIAADPEFLRLKGQKAGQTLRVAHDLFAEYRLFKLRRTVRHAAQHSRFYRSNLAADVDVEASDISGVLAQLPPTTPEDLSADPFAFLCISQSMVGRAVSFTSSGTVGPRKRVFFSMNDIDLMTDFMSAGMRTVAERDDVIQILLPQGPALGQCDLLARGVSKMGARAIVSGVHLPAEEQLSLIKEHGSTVLFGETHLIYRMTKLLAPMFRLCDFGIRTIFTTTSHASPVMKEYLATAWGARISTHYGLTEMGLGLAVDCPACQGRHFNELDTIAEVVDPQTGTPLPTGSLGELVFTTLGREAMPLLRYRTRDLSRIRPARANCPSRALSVIDPVKCRLESQIALSSGAIINPATFHDALFSLPEVVDYDLSVVRAAPGTERLVFDIEVTAPTTPLHRAAADAAARELRLMSGKDGEETVAVRLRPVGLERRDSHFKKIIRDLR